MAAQFLHEKWTPFQHWPESSAFSSLGCAKEPYWKSPVLWLRDEAWRDFSENCETWKNCWKHHACSDVVTNTDHCATCKVLESRIFGNPELHAETKLLTHLSFQPSKGFHIFHGQHHPCLSGKKESSISSNAVGLRFHHRRGWSFRIVKLGRWIFPFSFPQGTVQPCDRLKNCAAHVILSSPMFPKTDRNPQNISILRCQFSSLSWTNYEHMNNYIVCTCKSTSNNNNLSSQRQLLHQGWWICHCVHPSLRVWVPDISIAKLSRYPNSRSLL